MIKDKYTLMHNICIIIVWKVYNKNSIEYISNFSNRWKNNILIVNIMALIINNKQVIITQL